MQTSIHTSFPSEAVMEEAMPALVEVQYTSNSPKVIRVGPGFWNFRGHWKYKGLIDIGSHMSALQLDSGKFVIFDTIELTEEIKAELDGLTKNGELIEAAVMTHPFHVASLPAFYAAYPDLQYYGTPRHLRKFPKIPWQGDVFECRARSMWVPQIEMRIPQGMEFVRPLPEKTNHMCGMFVYHVASRTIHECDTIMVGHKPNVLLKIDGYRHRRMRFHQSITGPGLLPSPESPFAFKDWLLDIIADWEFDNVAAAHMGVMIGGAKKELQRLIIRSDAMLLNLQKRFKKKGAVSYQANGKHSLNLETELFDSQDTTCECG